MTQNDALFLVSGATGTQGGATARALLDAGRKVRILTRNAAGPAAQALARRGAEVATGDWNEPATLAAALRGAYGVFSIQRPDADGTDAERRHGFALIEAARAAGVQHIVHTSVCQVDDHWRFPRWDEGYWDRKYWTDKAEVEQAVRNAGFAHWTVLRPTFFMENFARPKGAFLFPQLRQGIVMTPVLPGVHLQLIAGDDLGAFARAAFTDPARFSGEIIEIASDEMSMSDTVATLARGVGKPLQLQSVSAEAALAAGIYHRWVRSQEWINVVGYRVDAAKLPQYGVPLTPFARWLQQHAGDIDVGA